jgi:hypothetical protein
MDKAVLRETLVLRVGGVSVDFGVMDNWSCGYDECPFYDGKRCKLLGARPGDVCEPLLMQVRAVVMGLAGVGEHV